MAEPFTTSAAQNDQEDAEMAEAMSQKAAQLATPIPYAAESAFFGFNPLTFVDDIYNATDDYVCDGVDALEQCLRGLEKDDRANAGAGGGGGGGAGAGASSSSGGGGASAEANERIARGCDQIIAKIRGVVDKNFDKFEIYVLKNIFHMPPDLEWKSSDGTVNSNAGGADNPLTPSRAKLRAEASGYTEEDEQRLDAELESLRARVGDARTKARALRRRRDTAAARARVLRAGVAALRAAASDQLAAKGVTVARRTFAERSRTFECRRCMSHTATSSMARDLGISLPRKCACVPRADR